jgi:hypothetical protein
VLCNGPSHLIYQVNPLYGQLLIYQVHISLILGVLLIYKLYQPYVTSTDISVSAVCTSLLINHHPCSISLPFIAAVTAGPPPGSAAQACGVIIQRA